MLIKWIVVRFVILAALLCGVLLGQEKPAAPSATGVLEFPVTMRQNVIAGQTAVGTKVEAKLTMATLVNGTVVPEGATFSGEVIESVGKSATEPSRLGLRMDSVQWKKGSVPVKIYLTAWYYPIQIPSHRDHQGWDRSQPPGSPADTRMPSASQRFPTDDEQRNPDHWPDSSSSNDSNHRTLMKDVESTRDSDGAIAITSKHSNIKLDKSTTYVLATDELTAAK